MAKKKNQTYEEKMTEALNKLPSPIIDKRHNLSIFLENDRARTNQTRIEHIIDDKHDLKPQDIKRIPQEIKKCIFKKDSERKETFNIYIRRAYYSKEYIKISLEITNKNPHIGIIKTIFITKHIK